MAFKPNANEEAILNNTPAAAQWDRAVKYLSHYRHHPISGALERSDENCCLGSSCDCMSRPTPGLKKRMAEGRLKQPLNKLELTMPEKKLLMEADPSTGIFYNSLKMV